MLSITEITIYFSDTSDIQNIKTFLSIFSKYLDIEIPDSVDLDYLNSKNKIASLYLSIDGYYVFDTIQINNIEKKDDQLKDIIKRIIKKFKAMITYYNIKIYYVDKPDIVIKENDNLDNINITEFTDLILKKDNL